MIYGNGIEYPESTELRQSEGPYEMSFDEPIEIAPPLEPIEDPEEQRMLDERSFLDRLQAWADSENIAEEIADDELVRIGTQVVEDYNADRETRNEWFSTYQEAIKIAKLVSSEKRWGGEIVSNIKYPLITSAAIQFNARMMPEIIKGNDVVRFKIVGKDPEDLKKDRAERMAEHMSWQLLTDMGGWEDDLDQLLMSLPVVGSMFRKTYYDGERNRSELVYPDDLIINYYAKSIERAERISHRIHLTKNEIIERVRAGLFLDIPLDELGEPDVSADMDDDLEDPKAGNSDSADPYIFIEQHRLWDLDGDGYAEPYIVTVHRESMKVVRITARYDIEKARFNDTGEVIRLEPVHYFTHYRFMPSFDGGFNGEGFGRLLQPLNKVINTTINQLIDAGTRQNRPSGFLGKGIRLGGRRGAAQGMRIPSGQWVSVDVQGDDIRKNIIPLPTGEPSSVLFQLLGMMIDAGKELAAQTDILAGQSPGANASPTTTLALIEQGLKVYSGIFRRVFRSLKDEFQKLRRLNRMYLDNDRYMRVLDEPADVLADYKSDDFDVEPVADPNRSSDTQRIMQAEALLQIKDAPEVDRREIYRRYVEAIGIDGIEKIIPEQTGPDPVQQLEMQKIQEEINKIVAETRLAEEKANALIVDQQAKMREAETNAEKMKLEKARAAMDMQSRQTDDAIKKAEAGKRMMDQDVNNQAGSGGGMAGGSGN